MQTKQLTIDIPNRSSVSAVLMMGTRPQACYVMAHGAGAGMQHPFMVSVAEGLCARGIATLRYQFPSMEQGSKRPDRPETAQAAVRAAVAAAEKLLPSVALIAGGKSFGGRMTSQAQAASPLSGVRGIMFFGFPLHPAKKPSTSRADHLSKIKIPMLFLQGTRDALADEELLAPMVKALGARATLEWAQGADHAFHVLARSGTTDAEVLDHLLDRAQEWIRVVVARS